MYVTCDAGMNATPGTSLFCSLDERSREYENPDSYIPTLVTVE